MELSQPIHAESHDVFDLRGLRGFFAACAGLYLFIYAFESPVRYLLYLAGKDSLILLRDGLILVPIAVLVAVQAARLKLHPAVTLFAILIAFHGLVLFGTIGSLEAVAYGGKILVNLLFGFLAAGLLAAPSGRMRKLFLLLWCATLAGVLLDKFFVTFPWVGIKTIVGDLTVDVSKDWQIQDSLSRRVAGFARSSICVAVLVPVLAIPLMSTMRRWLPRAAIGLVSIAAVFLTTQKGSLIAFLPISLILMLRPPRERVLLQIFFVLNLTLMAGLPLMTAGWHVDHGSGVFSTESLYLRIADTWPRAWHWITHHQMTFLGVGLGGIGGPQRLYAPDDFNPADNFFILLYAYFGLFALVYIGLMAWLVLRPRATEDRPEENGALALVTFAFGYGAVLSVVEDQAASLFLGAALGALWQAMRAQRARAMARRFTPASGAAYLNTAMTQTDHHLPIAT